MLWEVTEGLLLLGQMAWSTLCSGVYGGKMCIFYSPTLCELWIADV